MSSGLSLAVFSITPTRRRRFFWAAWWTGEPCKSPFRNPDASGGGARTRDEALREAEKRAGRALTEIDPEWARAFARVMIGEPAFSTRALRDGEKKLEERPAVRQEAIPSIWLTLGLTPQATLLEIKRAYRARALQTHPDRGGSEEAFRAVHAAYEVALKRREKRDKKPKPRPKPAGPRQA